MLKKWISGWRSGRALPDSLSYEDSREVLEAQNRSARLALACREDAPPETLYYLGQDDQAEVRRHVAANPSTPRHADAFLVDDEDAEVREELARKISRLLPDLDDAATKKVRDLTLSILDRLSRDQLPRVRRILAEELKLSIAAPREVIGRLARDEDDAVASPILQYSPLLKDEDLRELIAAGLAADRLASIAQRDGLSADIADDVAASLEVPAVAALLLNESADVREQTLNMIAEHAEGVAEWHGPLTLRPDLSQRVVKRIASFLGRDLLSRLSERIGLDPDTQAELRDRLSSRLATDEGETAHEDDAAVLEKVRRAAQEGRLDDAFVAEAINADARALAEISLAVLAKRPRGLVNEVLNGGAPNAVCALFWRAGLSMRTALLAQERLTRIPQKDRLLPKNGVDYPLTNEELEWWAEFALGEDARG